MSRLNQGYGNICSTKGVGGVPVRWIGNYTQVTIILAVNLRTLRYECCERCQCWERREHRGTLGTLDKLKTARYSDDLA